MWSEQGCSPNLPAVETLTDGLGSLSKSPRRDRSRSSYTQSWDQHPHTHKHTHTVGRTEDETTLCQHRIVLAMLMTFIWIHVGLYRRERGRMKQTGGEKKKKATHADWNMTEKWWLPWSVYNWESEKVKPRKESLDKNLKGIQQGAWTD